MLSENQFLTFTDRNMVRKVALELDSVQKALVGETLPGQGFISGCLERACSYLRYALGNRRLKIVASAWLVEAEAIAALPFDTRLFFKRVNDLYYLLAEYANMPVSESHFHIRTSDTPEREPDRFPCVAVLDNLRSAFNVGTIFRTADGFGAESLLLTGITPGPDNKKVQKTSMGAWDYVPWAREPDTAAGITGLRDRGYTIYALETMEGSDSVFACDLQFPLAVHLGNEEFGVLEDCLALADEVLRIPMFGIKNSFNVGVSFGMLLFEARRQWEASRKASSL